MPPFDSQVGAGMRKLLQIPVFRVQFLSILKMCMRRFSIATTPSLQDGIAKELSDNGLLAHGEDREPRLPDFDDLSKLPYLTAVRPCSSGIALTLHHIPRLM